MTSRSHHRASGPLPEATALTRLRWARDLLAGVEAARAVGLLRGVESGEAAEALEALSAQVKCWRAWVRDAWVPARARARVTGHPVDPVLYLQREERLRSLLSEAERLTDTSERLAAAAMAAGPSAARAVPRCCPDGLAVDDLLDPADGSARPG